MYSHLKNLLKYSNKYLYFCTVPLIDRFTQYSTIALRVTMFSLMPPGDGSKTLLAQIRLRKPKACD